MSLGTPLLCNLCPHCRWAASLRRKAVLSKPHEMILAARTVLQDCREAAALFTPGLHGAKWRIAYMANVALLRAVYHVLKSRDAHANSHLRNAFKSWDGELWISKSNPEPHIYWNFILDERNLVLKEYQSSAGQGVTVPGKLIEIGMQTGQQTVTQLGEVEHHYIMNTGHFAGRDQRDLIQEAIAWWEAQLSRIESDGAITSQPPNQC